MANETYFHLAVYSGSVPTGTGLTQVNAVNDSILTLQNNQLILPENGRLVVVAGVGTNLSRIRLNTPSVRQVSLPYYNPVNTTATVQAVPNVADLTSGPITIPFADAIAWEAQTTDVGTQSVTILNWYNFGYRPVPNGQRYRIRATSTITAVASTWANGPITLEQTLPMGNYAVVGMDVVGTNLLAARLIFPGSSYRPGVLPRNAEGNDIWDGFQDGRLGMYGVFNSVNQPNLEIFAIGANTSQVTYLDLVKISG